jgi:hypothetical protein
VFLDFHARLDQLFKTELKANRKQLQNFLVLPHSYHGYETKKSTASMPSSVANPKAPVEDEPFRVSVRFLDDMPYIYKRKEEVMITHLRKAISTDERTNERFETIVNNIKFSFQQKIEALKELHKEVQNKEEKNMATQLIFEKVA